MKYDRDQRYIRKLDVIFRQRWNFAVILGGREETDEDTSSRANRMLIAHTIGTYSTLP